MEDPEPYQQILPVLSIFNPDAFTFGVAIGIVVIVLLLLVSAMVSGSEVAFFSLLPAELDKIRNGKGKVSNIAHGLINHPDRLLATILITNNFVNVGIVIISTFITNTLFDFSQSKLLGIFIQVVIITFLILFFSEVLPKVYANRFVLPFAFIISDFLIYY